MNLLRDLESKIQKAVNMPDLKLEIPPQEIRADFAIPAFSFDVKKIAEAIQKAGLEEIKEVVVSGKYINIKVNREKFYRQCLEYRPQPSKENDGKTVVIDLSSPNIAKPLGFGHLRSTIIGNSLGNIYEWSGYKVTRDNHLGDWGTQFGELIYAYQKWGSEEAVSKNPVAELKSLYVRFQQEAQNNPDLEEKARRIFNDLEKGDEKLLSLWKKFKDWSIKDFEKTYKRLGVKFDSWLGESFFTRETEEVISDCLKKKICREEEGVVLIDCLKEVPSFLLRKKDGSTLYLARELATLNYRLKNLKPDVILYVVGSEQSLHFKQVFALAEKMGYVPKGVELEHVSFGLVLREGKKMSTRAGTTINLEEVLDEAAERAEKILKSNNPDLSEPEIKEAAEIIGIGAVLYNDLRQSRTQNITFDWERALSLESGSSAYLQYAYVRIKSILAKAGEGEKISDYVFENEREFELAKKIIIFPEIIERAGLTNMPHHIAVYLEELAQIFSGFYAEVAVIGTKDKNLFNSRVALIKLTAEILKNGLSLLGIKVPAKM